MVPFGWTAPSCLAPLLEPFKKDISNKYLLYKVYMGLIIEGTIPRVPAIFPIIMEDVENHPK